eukprot:COSAG05_NODE_1198_length_5555_cov_3.672287_5_plen_161_part_00
MCGDIIYDPVQSVTTTQGMTRLCRWYVLPEALSTFALQCLVAGPAPPSAASRFSAVTAAAQVHQSSIQVTIRVRLKIIRNTRITNARITNVGKYQPRVARMFSQLWIKNARCETTAGTALTFLFRRAFKAAASATAGAGVAVAPKPLGLSQLVSRVSLFT